MQCPYCQCLAAELWLPMFVTTEPNGAALPDAATAAGYLVEGEETVEAVCIEAGIDFERFVKERNASLPIAIGLTVKAEWMRCPSPECQQLILRARREIYDPQSKSGRSVVFGVAEYLLTDETIAFPKKRIARSVDPLILDAFAAPFKQACLILDDSPGMSAVLSRRVLADLLEQKGGYKGYTVKEQIDQFIADPQRPSGLKENLHYLREMADFAAHTKTDITTGEILETTPEEAEWTLNVVERLFDHFIVGPARDETMRKAMAAKMQQAGRKAIPPLNQEGQPKS